MTTEAPLSVEIEKPMLRRHPVNSLQQGLPLLSLEKRQEMLEEELLIMNEAWSAAKSHRPEGFVFVQGDRYKRSSMPRDRSPKEKLLLSFYMSSHEVTQAEYSGTKGTPSLKGVQILPGQSIPMTGKPPIG